MGHEVDIFAEWNSGEKTPAHRDIDDYKLLDRTTYLNLDIPPPTGAWNMPVWPITGKTWISGTDKPIPNYTRILSAFPILLHSLFRSPRITLDILNPKKYHDHARSFLSLYQFSKLWPWPKKYDIIHAHFGPMGMYFRFTRKIWRAPFIVSFHGFDLSTSIKQQGCHFYDSMYSEIDLITVNSEYARIQLENVGCPPQKVIMLKYGVDTGRFSSKERSLKTGEKVRILTVGRLVEKKGIEYSIKAMASIIKDHPNIHYDIIGDGPLRSNLQTLIQRLSLTDHLTLHGALQEHEVLSFMSRAHLFLLPSVTAANGDQEGTPVSLIEAQACGIPVISTKHAGIPEIVLDGKSGLLVPERDVNALADRIIYLIKNPEVLPEMGRIGRKKIEENHNSKSLNHQLVKIYEKLISKS